MNAHALIKAVCKKHFFIDLETNPDLPAGVHSNVGFFVTGDDLGFGHALIWAVKNKVVELNIFTPELSQAQEYALFATALDGLTVKAYQVVGADLIGVEPVTPPKVPEASEQLTARANELISSFESSAGLAVLSQSSSKITAGEGEVITAEYASISCAGLEIARVIEYQGESVIEIGVGQADREIHALTSEGSAEQILEPVISEILKVRHSERDKFHPLAKLDPAGYMRFTDSDSQALPNLRIDDVFSDSPRFAYNKESKQLVAFAANASPELYENIASSICADDGLGTKDLVVKVRDQDISYINTDVLNLLRESYKVEPLVGL